MADKKATVHIDGLDPIELPIYQGTAGQDVIDVRTLGSHLTATSLTTQVSCRPVLVNLQSLTSMAAKVFYYTVVTQSSN